MSVKIAPSILSADFAELGTGVEAIATADYVHFDVMDGCFVPNISIGIPVLQSIRKRTALPIDVHLMIVQPVDSYVDPIPWAMPGYDSEVIMAAGAFVQGSSIELSADGPIRPPYAVYFQGGLTWYHAKLGILMSLQKLVDAGLVTLDQLEEK